jgi:hypothetical protein
MEVNQRICSMKMFNLALAFNCLTESLGLIMLVLSARQIVVARVVAYAHPTPFHLIA